MPRPDAPVATDLAASAAGRDVLPFLLELLEEITADIDLEPLSADSELGSLGLESINLVYLIAELQQELGLGDALISLLRRERIDVRTLRAGVLARLVERLRAPVPAASAAPRAPH
jgi:aryl carrier-like protein